MANYSQPPYGAPPFPFPPQQMQHPMPNAPPEAQGGHPDMQHAPPAFYLPGLHQQHAPSPSINHHHHQHHQNHASYSHNIQHPGYPHGTSRTLDASTLRKTDFTRTAAWPPPDPNAFFAFMQTASMNGQPPPPFPGYGFPPQSIPPPTPQHPATPTAFLPQPARTTLPARERVQEVMDSDREDGEVSEGDAKSHPSAVKINGRAHPEPPRSVPYAKPQSPRGLQSRPARCWSVGDQGASAKASTASTC
jgi:hypothetical protein